MKTSVLKMTGSIIFLLSILCFSQNTKAQDQDRSITAYQYRHVPADKVDEFLKRETTYWSKVAQKAVDNKKLSFWALFEKVGGYDLPNSSNYLFINTYPDIDKVGEVWADAEKTAGVKMADMETNSISTTTSMFFLHSGGGWAQAENAVPADDFNYVVMVYHNTDNADSLIGLENKYWQPFIKDAMDNGLTTQKAWGNSVVLSPSGDDIKFRTVSYDIYKTLTDALMPNWKPETQIPTDGLQKINALETNRRGSVVYRVVKVISSGN